LGIFCGRHSLAHFRRLRNDCADESARSSRPGEFQPSLIGMAFSFLAGLIALHWLPRWLEHGR